MYNKHIIVTTDHDNYTIPQIYSFKTWGDAIAAIKKYKFRILRHFTTN